MPQRFVDAPSTIQGHQFAEVVDESSTFTGGYRLKLALVGIGRIESDPKEDEAGVVIVAASFDLPPGDALSLM